MLNAMYTAYHNTMITELLKLIGVYALTTGIINFVLRAVLNYQLNKLRKEVMKFIFQDQPKAGTTLRVIK